MQSDYQDAEFNSAFLVGNAKNTDMSRYQKGNPVLPGRYDLDIYINGKQALRTKVEFIRVDDGNIAQACLTYEGLRRIGIDSQQIEAYGGCRPLTAVIPDAKSYADISQQRLYLRVPQASLRRTPRGYVDPQYWDAGITAAKFDYNLSYFGSDHDDFGSNDSAYLGLRSAMNFGLWQFRHNANVNWSNGSKTHWNKISTYLQRPLPGIKSLLTAGEINTKGEGFDSVAVRGLSLSSDERMYPDSQIGFAPTVRSFARTNARVEVWQNDIKLYQTTVTPGNFVIDDLYPTGYGGDLNVVVTEADGSVRRFDVPYASVTNLLRPGRNKYDLVMGRLYNQSLADDSHVLQGTWYHGVDNYLTGYGGLQASDGFHAVLVGAGLNTSIGAFSLDAITERTDIGSGHGSSRGHSVKLAYSKLVSETRTNVTLAAYRYSSSEYLTLSQAVDARERARDTRFKDEWFSYNSERNRFDISVDQPVGEYGSLFLTGSTSKSWGDGGSSRQFEVGFNGYLGDVSYSISASRNNDEFFDSSTQYFLSVNIPLGHGPKSPTLSSQYTTGRGRGSTLRSYLSGVADDAGRLSYGVTGATDTNTSGSGSVNAQYRGNRTTVRGSYEQGGDYKSFSMGSDGTLLVHGDGLTLAPNTGETIALVSAPGGEGARIAGLSGMELDGDGHGLMPYLSPYRLNTVNLDPKGSSMSAAFQTTSQQVAPYAGAIVKVDFPTRVGQSAVIHITNGSSLELPFGADVQDSQGNVVGVVGQGNNVFVQGIADSGTLMVGLDGGSNCQVSYRLGKAVAKQVMQKAEAPCQPVRDLGLSSR